MSDYTVHATITVKGDGIDRARLQSTVDAGLKELDSIARRYGFEITSSSATVDEA